ncbi:hypothetical protein OHB44_10265 [Micromonospora sp. NBC_00821]|uniref:hypothetical protein n=1 Tax=Micromonospora sp. NBC_00821 TaxID=2975977 RepID=UPI002ED666CF|nr:hypothetical protein OHB44_10265 [Micromonospora sp. NBC_00821]
MKRETFIESARQLGQLVFQDQAAGRMDLAALHAGVMLEHLSKAHLVGLHPVYILRGDKADFDSLLKACGHPEFASPNHQTKTISLSEALQRIAKVLPKFKFAQAELKHVVDARDGAVHAALRPDAGAGTVRLALTAVGQILDALDVDPAEFWGGYADTARVLVAERADSIGTAVRLRLAEAGRIFAMRFGHLSTAQLAEVAEAPGLAFPAFITNETHAEEQRCPACSHKGWLVGFYGAVYEAVTVLADGGDPPSQIRPSDAEAILEAERFVCPYCSLELEGQEELNAADLPSIVFVRKSDVFHRLGVAL